MSTVLRQPLLTTSPLPLQEASLSVWASKYRLVAKDGEPVDDTIDDSYQRIARAIAECEANTAASEEGTAKREHWYQQFLWAA